MTTDDHAFAISYGALAVGVHPSPLNEEGRP